VLDKFHLIDMSTDKTAQARPGRFVAVGYASLSERDIEPGVRRFATVLVDL
jgi:DNA-binding transcriptional MocR family regulator